MSRVLFFLFIFEIRSRHAAVLDPKHRQPTQPEWGPRRGRTVRSAPAGCVAAGSSARLSPPQLPAGRSRDQRWIAGRLAIFFPFSSETAKAHMANGKIRNGQRAPRRGQQVRRPKILQQAGPSSDGRHL
ncbi:hypothetical protein BC567DRAFT_228485 [Phyllosticta citribraziliensis]